MNPILLLNKKGSHGLTLDFWGIKSKLPKYSV